MVATDVTLSLPDGVETKYFRTKVALQRAGGLYSRIPHFLLSSLIIFRPHLFFLFNFLKIILISLIFYIRIELIVQGRRKMLQEVTILQLITILKRNNYINIKYGSRKGKNVT